MVTGWGGGSGGVGGRVRGGGCLMPVYSEQDTTTVVRTVKANPPQQHWVVLLIDNIKHIHVQNLLH